MNAESAFPVAVSVAIVVATLLGPILAIQVQKWLERRSAQDTAKRAVFAALMYTRATRLSVQHIQALNGIELAFYKDRQVMAAWKTYLDNLSTPITDSNVGYVMEKRNDLFVDMLYSMSQLLGYPFSREDIKKSAYAPQAHVDLEQQQDRMRMAILKLLEGAEPLRVVIREFEPPQGTSMPPPGPRGTRHGPQGPPQQR